MSSQFLAIEETLSTMSALDKERLYLIISQLLEITTDFPNTKRDERAISLFTAVGGLLQLIDI